MTREISENLEPRETSPRTKTMKFWQSVGRKTKQYFVKKREQNSPAKDRIESAVLTVSKKLAMIHDPERDLLRSPCFYWPQLDSKSSAMLIKSRPDGTFLVRRSSHPQYKYTVTYKRDGQVASARIQHCRESALYSFNFASKYLPKMHTIRELLKAVAGQNIAMRREGDLSEVATNMRLEVPMYRPMSLMEQCKARVLESCQHNENIDELEDLLPKYLIQYLKK